MRPFKLKIITFYTWTKRSHKHTLLCPFCTDCRLPDIISNCCTPHLQSVCLSNVLATLTDTVSQPPVHNSAVMDYTPAATETAGTLSRHAEHTGNTQLLSIILTRRPEKRKHLIHKKHKQDVQVERTKRGTFRHSVVLIKCAYIVVIEDSKCTFVLLLQAHQVELFVRPLAQEQHSNSLSRTDWELDWSHWKHLREPTELSQSGSCESRCVVN